MSYFDKPGFPLANKPIQMSMEIQWLVYFSLMSLMFVQEALFETPNLSMVDSSNQESRETKTRIKKKDLTDEATMINNLLENKANIDTHQNYSELQYSPRSFNSQTQKKRLQRKKLMKKMLNRDKGIYIKRFTQNAKQFPVQTLQQHIFSNENLTSALNLGKQNFGRTKQDFDNYFNRGMLSFKNPFVIKRLPHIDGKLSDKNNLIRNDLSRTKSNFFFDSPKDKAKPKRFFGGLLAGSVTTLEMAIKVNIPIPFCQFPNSPCKI